MNERTLFSTHVKGVFVNSWGSCWCYLHRISTENLLLGMPVGSIESNTHKVKYIVVLFLESFFQIFCTSMSYTMKYEL